MDTIIRFKNRETTARQGKLPNNLLIFVDFNLKMDELNLVYDSIRNAIGICSINNRYDIIHVYINLLLDIEDIFEEIEEKYKNSHEYVFQIPLHVLELNFLIKALKDYSFKIENNEQGKKKLYDLNLLVNRTTQLLKENFKILKQLYTKYNKAKRLDILKELWSNP